MVDIPGNSSTDATISVGGTVAGALEVIGDHDWYRIQLTAGQQITVLLTGVTLEDPYLRIRNSAGTTIFESDDISAGVIRDSRVSFTAPTAGTYFIDAGAWDDDYAGTYELSVAPYTPPPEWSFDQVADFLAYGSWSGEYHAYAAAEGGTITVNITALTGGGQYLAAQSLALWSDVTGINFVQVGTGGQIVFDDNEDGAFAESIYSGGITTSSIINVSTEWVADYGTAIGGYAFQTYIHEIGHALGLGHTGYYNVTGDYFSEAVFANDGWPTSVMSYFSQAESSYFSDRGFSEAYVTTPMIGDIAAIQLLYGLSTTTRIGDTTYGFNSNAGRDSFNASLHADVAYTIFDSGGVDTLNYSGFSSNQFIDLAPAAFSNVGGLTGNVAIAGGTVIENAIGGSGHDDLLGNAADNHLSGGAGNDSLHGLGGDDALFGGSGNDWLYGDGGHDVLSGGVGVDTLIGAAGGDTFQGSAAEMSGDTISEFTAEDRIVISGANLATFTHALSGSTLTYSGGSLTLGGVVTGTLVASAAAEGGVQLTLSNDTPPPPPPPPSPPPDGRAKLILTEAGQDFEIGGDVRVFGTAGGGETIEVIRGDIVLDGSFNIGGDTVVLPGLAGSYTATLSGSFVTIASDDVSIAIPVGAAGVKVQFDDSSRTLRFDTDSGAVMLGTQPVTSTTQQVESSGPPLADVAEIGPDSLGKLILTDPGQDIDIGGNVAIFGTSATGEVLDILHGTIELDGSFNIGGDTVVLAGNAGSYEATLSGSFVTIAGSDTSIAIPVGVAGLEVQFDDGARTLRFDPDSGHVMLGNQAVTSTTQPVEPSAQASAAMFTDEDAEIFDGITLDSWSTKYANDGQSYTVHSEQFEGSRDPFEVASFHFG